MPRSSNPAVLVFVVLYLLLGAFFVMIGAVFAAGGGIWLLVGGPFLLGGLSSIFGAYTLVKQWLRSIRAEKETADYMRQAVASGGSLSGGVLAHWVYDAEEWAAYTKREASFRRRQAAVLALGTLVIVTLGGIVAAGDPAAGFGIGCVVAALVGVARWIRAAVANRANRSAALPEVVIGSSCILFNGRYQVLRDHQYNFGGVRLLENERPPILEFTVTWKTRRGTSNEQIRVPVPRGHEDEARALLDRFPRADAGAPSLATVG
jgi:hypothetical protein